MLTVNRLTVSRRVVTGRAGQRIGSNSIFQNDTVVRRGRSVDITDFLNSQLAY